MREFAQYKGTIMLLRSSSFLLLPVILLLAGCGNPGRDVSQEAIESMAGGELKETVPVSGKVLHGGQPANRVTLYAYSRESGMKPAAETTTKSDGTYCWSTYTDCDGLPPGEYRLAFKKAGPREKPGAPDKWGGKYLNPMKNDFVLTIESGKPQTDVNYELD